MRAGGDVQVDGAGSESLGGSPTGLRVGDGNLADLGSSVEELDGGVAVFVAAEVGVLDGELGHHGEPERGIGRSGVEGCEGGFTYTESGRSDFHDGQGEDRDDSGLENHEQYDVEEALGALLLALLSRRVTAGRRLRVAAAHLDFSKERRGVRNYLLQRWIFVFVVLRRSDVVPPSPPPPSLLNG